MRVFVFFVFVFLLSTRGADAESFTVAGYELWLTCAQRGDRVYLEGRISYGEACRNLRVDALVENPEGETKRIRAWIEGAGGFGSRLVEGSSRCEKGGRPWRIRDIEIKCLARHEPG